MSAPASGVATRLFASLQAVGCEVTAVELADILWLARYVPASRRAEPGSTSPSTPVPPAPPQLHDPDATRKSSSDTPAPPSLERENRAADGLYARVERDARLTRGRRATLVRAPGAPALPNALALSRALRPLLKKRVSRHRWQLDEEATAEATALNHGVATPVFRPSAERWFEVALVVDGAPSMHVWHQAAGELRRLLMRHGGFRDLRQYRLRPAGELATNRASGGADERASNPARALADDHDRDGIELISESGRRLTPNAISDPSGRRLIVVLSDVVSPMWRELPLRRALYAWSRWSPVVLVDVLPRRMWPHTAIGFAERTMAPRRAAAPNAEWMVERDWWDIADAGDGADGARARRRHVTLPVITLAADQFGRWARALMQVSAERCAGTLLPLESVSASLDEATGRSAAPSGAAEPMTALERVQHFRSAASAPAYQLACYFAATRPVLPVLRIVQRQMMPETGPGHLAEFLLSGLVRPRTTEQATETPAGKSAGRSAEHESAGRVDPERVEYEFYPGVQDLLLAQLDVSEVTRIMPAIEAYLKTHLGESYELSALIPDDRGAEKISAEARPFVEPAFELMQRILGRRPRAARTASVYDRLVGVLGRAFPDRDIGPYVEDARGLPDEEVRSSLISAAIELMPDEQREALLPLAVTLPSPSLPMRLWRSLLVRTRLAPLGLMDGVKFAEDDSLAVTADVRAGLRSYLSRERRPAMHRRIIEAYLGSGEQGPQAELPPFSDTYFYRHILAHVVGAEYDDLAQSIVSNPEWIEGKRRICGFADLLADLDRFPHIPAIRALREIVARRGDKDQESTQGWAESLIEEWASTLSDAEANAPVETLGEATAETPPPSTEDTAATAATATTDASVADAPPKVWVLVLGTGARALTEFERDVTVALGTRLAQDGHGLIRGNWHGIDALIAESFAKEVTRLGGRLGDSMIRAAPIALEANFKTPSGEIQSYDSDNEFFDRALERPDVVVLIGGEGATLDVGHVARSHLVPVIPVAATGGGAARLFDELVRDQIYRPDDPLNTPRRSDGSLQRIVDRIAELVRDAEPSRHVVSLAEDYVRTFDRVRGDRIEARLLTLLERGAGAGADLHLAISQAAKNLSVTKCLAAFVYRAKPDPAHTPSLFEPDDSPHVVLQRVRACEVAFETQATRDSLPADIEERLTDLYSMLDETRDAITRQAKEFIASRLMPLAKLVTLAEQAASPRFNDMVTLRHVASTTVRLHMALDCLTDPHPGWRLIGLAAFTEPALMGAHPPADLVSRILQATRFEGTFRSHLRLAVEAIDYWTWLSRPLNLDEIERATLERIREQVRSDSSPAVPTTSIERAKLHAAELAVLVERYHAIRREQPSSDERVEDMEAVVRQMRAVVTDAEGFDVQARLDDNDRGWRLAAYAFVQERPDGALYVPLCRSLLKYLALPGPVQPGSVDNRPFGESHGLLALDHVDETLSTLSNDQRIAWEAVQRAIRVDPASDRGRLLSRISRRRRNIGRYDRPDRVGDLLRRTRRLSEALDAYREWLSIIEGRAAGDSGKTNLQGTLARAHGRVGLTLELLGNDAESLVHRRAALDIWRKLAASRPSDTGYQRDSAFSAMEVGNLLTAQSDFIGALIAYEESLVILRQLATTDPTNLNWQHHISTIRRLMASLHAQADAHPTALRIAEETLATAQRLLAADPANTQVQQDVAASRALVERLRGRQSE